MNRLKREEDAMKLADALILRADNQRRLEELKQRLLRVAKVQDGEKPAEDPEALLREIERTSNELESIIQKINSTNSSTQVEDGQTISDALATRDVLRLKFTVYRELAKAAAITQDRYSRSEVKFKSTVDVAKIQSQADDLAKQHRELDAKIQEVNWLTELAE